MKKNESHKIQVKKSHYFNLKYDSKARWASYWYQISEVLATEPKSILEIGPGNKTVSDYLKKLKVKVKTCDIDSALEPDVTANVLNLPFNKDSFSTVLCSEVLEHVPFTSFSEALNQINRVTKNYVVLTLPHFSVTNLYFGTKLVPFVPKKEFSFKVDLPVQHKFLGEHYWEIGKKDYPINLIKSKISEAGFKIEKSFYPNENPYHHFFTLKKG